MLENFEALRREVLLEFALLGVVSLKSFIFLGICNALIRYYLYARRLIRAVF